MFYIKINFLNIINYIKKSKYHQLHEKVLNITNSMKNSEYHQLHEKILNIANLVILNIEDLPKKILNINNLGNIF